MNSRLSQWRIAQLGLLAVLAGLLAHAAFAQDEAPEVAVHKVAAQDISEVLELPTRLRALEATVIIPRVEGNLLERMKKSGDTVKAGDLLYAIQPKPFEIELKVAETQLDQAKARLVLAEATVARAEALVAKKTISQQSFDEYLSDYNVALSDMTAAERNLELANIRLGHTQITAKGDGVITNEVVAINDLVGPSRGSLGRLDQVHRMRAFVFLDEKLDTQFYQRVLAGETLSFDIRLRLPTREIYALPGEVFAFDNAIDPATGTRAIQMVFDNPDLLLSPGLSGTVLLSENRGSGLLAVPQNAVQQDQLGHYVLTVGEGDILKQRHLDLGAQIDTWWVVLGGLEAGETIVAGSLQRVRPGMTITPVTQ